MNNSPDLESHEKPSNSSSPLGPSWLKIAILAGVVALISITYFTNRAMFLPGPDVHTVDPEEVAKRTPIQDFIVTDADGSPKKLSEFRGSVVILSFWASWCTPCLVELPTFAEIEDKFRERGLKILAVNVDDGDTGKTFAHDFWEKKKFPFPTYFDKPKTVAQQFEVDMLPSNFVIDREGRLVFSSFGANDWSSAETVEFLEQLLNEEAQPSS